jgi:hypothetical protein
MALGVSLRGGSRVGERARRPHRAAWAGGLFAILWCLAGAGCGPAGEGTRAGATVLYVSNSGDGTLTRIDTAGGRVAGPAVPAGEAPWRLAAGPGGAVLAQPVAGGTGAGLTRVVRTPAGWQARPLPLEPGARSPLLAGGGRAAAVASGAAGGPDAAAGARCRLARVDLEQGVIGPARTVCAGRDSVVDLAAGGDGALVYLAVWRRPAAGQPCDAPTGSRVVALRAATGAPVASAALEGVPGPLVLAPAPDGVGQRLFAAEALPARELVLPGQSPGECAWGGYGERFEGARAWRVWSLDATTLVPEEEHAVPYPVRALAATPDGGDAYVLAGRAAVLRLAPAGGPARPFATLPDWAVGLAATDDQVFTLDAFGDRVWCLDRARGRVLRTIPTGRGPLGLALAGG